MSKEIKFRAWDEQTNTMLNDVCYMNTGHGYGKYSVVLPFKSENYYKAYGQQGWEIDHAHNAYKHNLKVMQFTGLTDKNGKEIYEGDICRQWDKDYFSTEKRHPSKILKVIKWNDDRPQFNFHNPKRLEIIGNIYENKDLLE